MEESVEITVDSLPGSAVDTLGVVTPVPDTIALLPLPVTADELFGARSTLQTGTIVAPAERHVYEAPLFQGAVLVLAILYLAILSSHLRDAWTLCKKLTLDPAKSRRMTEIAGGAYSRMLWQLLGIGLPLVALLLLCGFDPWIPDALVAQMESWTGVPGKVVIALVTVAVVAAIALFQVGLLRLSGAVVLEQRLTSHLVAIKFNYAALGTLLVAPLTLVYLLTPPEQAGVFFYAILAVAGVLLILFLKESVSLFLSERVPLLHWFLYLCIVELFPVSFFFVLATRN